MNIQSNAIHHYFESFRPRAETPRFSLFVFKCMLTINLWISVSRSRRQLAELEPHQLEDIGIAPSKANQEASRKFFDI